MSIFAVKSEIIRQALKPVSESQIYHIGELNRAINNNELCLQYQPRYNSNTGRLITVEALVRWNHPVHGLLYPGIFIPLAEEVGLINTLGLWVFEQSCKDLLWLSKQLEYDIRATINISPLQCKDTQQAQRILYICDRYDLAASRFEFEITRNPGNFDKNSVLDFCKAVAEAGAEYNIVDTGTAQTSFENLCDFPVNLIKMRIAFVKKIGCDSRREIIVKHLIELAHELKVKVIAVGIEHAYQRDLLIQLGCDQLQGFLMFKPAKLENITRSILRI